MNKSIVGIILAVLVIGGGATAIIATSSSPDDENSEIAQTETTDVMEKKDGDATEKTEDDVMMKKSETYVTLSDFNTNKTSYDEQKKVYFFHASWCPICKSIDEDISSDPTQIPSNTTFIKTDFDTSTELRQKYGVTSQYTFVQVDTEGNEVDQWSATSLDKAIAGIN